MTAIVAGQGLGLFNTSANVLGGDSGQIGVASQGRSGEKVAVNASTGNLVVQQQDEWLVGVGQDVGLLRTYNSLATGDGDNNDNWRLGLSRKINAASTTAPSITRVSDDGSELTYTNVSGKFVNKDGSGSFDTISWDATNSQWIWEDGNTHVKEYYKASGVANEYRLVQITDAGNSTASVTVNYDATSGLISSIKTFGGEVMELTYEAASVAGKKPHIKSVQLKSSASATTAYTKRVSYDYDAQDRLKKVWVDLSPEDGVTVDGKVYWTEYTYIDLTSNRLKTLKQSDDSQLEFHYDASNRIDWIKESLITGGEVRQTSFAYGTGNTTQITDATGNITELTYVNTAGAASYGQIQSIRRPLSGALLPTASFTYDTDGNVLTSTDARGNKTTYRYDSSGNCLYQEDAQGNVTERTFSSVNQVLTETVYSNRDTDLDGGASGALTTRYLYDATYPTRLRFAISPEGRVTQYTYNTLGQRTGAIQFPASAYAGLVQDFGANTTGLTSSPAFVRASNQLQYTASTTASSATISTTDASALGSLWSMDVSTPAAGSGTDLLFLGLESGTSATSTFRRLRLRISGNQFYTESQSGTSANAPVALGTAKVGTTYVVEFDTQADGGMTLYVYEKGKERSTGFKKVFAPDAGWSAPKLSIQGNSGAGAIAGVVAIDNLAAQWRPTLSDMLNWSNGLSDKTSWVRTDYAYDPLRGQLQYETTYASAETTGLGHVSPDWSEESWSDNYVQYIYDQSGNLLQKIDSAKADAMVYSDNSWALDQRKRLGLVYTVAGPNGGAGEGKKVVDLTPADRTLIASKASFNTVFVYDGLNRITKQTDPAGNVTLTTYDDASRTTKVELANGLTTTSTYDRSGALLVRAQVDKAAPAISLGSTEYTYDKMGRLSSTKVTSTGERTYILYDALGRKVGDIDAEGALTEYQYNSEDQLTRTVAYANKVSSAVLAALALDPSVGTVPANQQSNGLASWVATASNATKISSGLNNSAANTSGTTTLAGDATAWLKQIDGDATLTSQLQSGPITLPASGSRRFEVSAYVGVVGATASLSVQFFTTFPSSSSVPTATVDTGLSTSAKAGGPALSDYTRLAAYVDAPAGALYARVVVKKSATATGQTSSQLYVTHPLVAQTAVSGTIVKPFAALDVRPEATATADRGSWNIYDKAGRLAKTITVRGEGNYNLDEIGAVVEYRYDGAGRLTDTIAYATALSLGNVNGAPGLSKLRSALGEIQAGDGTLTIDGTTYTLQVDAANDRRTRNFYSADGLLIGQLDAENYYTKNTYDSAGRLTATTRYGRAIATVVPEGNTPPVPETTSIFDIFSGYDRSTRYYYNGRGQLVGTLDAEGYYTAYQYDIGGNKMLQTRYANTASNTLTSNALPLIVSSPPQGSNPYVLTNSEDHASKYFYDADNRLVRTQDSPSGVVTTYDYDKVGKLTKTTVALGTTDERTAQKRYDAAGRVIFELAGVGSTKLVGLTDQSAIDNVWKTYGTQYLYDAAGRLTATISPDGSGASGLKTIFYYDKAGRITHSINALGEIKQYSYNAFGEQIEVRGVATRVASATLATLAGGLNTALTAGAVVTGTSDAVASMVYSRDGQVRHAVDAENNATDTWYNTFGQVLWSDPPQLNGTDRYFEYSYDKRGLVKQVADMGGVAGAYSNTYSQYNAFGQLMTSTDARGKKTTYAYDRLGRTYAVTDAGTQNFGVATVYDAFNRVLTQTDRSIQHTTTYSYDSANRTVTITTAEGANPNTALSFKTTQVLNREGQIVSVTDGRGAYTQYTYDADGHLTNTKVKNASTDADSAALTSESSTYDNAGRVSTTTNAMGGVTTVTYDKASRVLVQTQTDGLGNTFKTQLRYDALGRAVWKQDASGTWTQTTFDRNGRVKTVVVDPKSIPSASQAADALDITLVSNSAGLALTTQFDYDAQGHVVLLTEGVGSTQPKKTQYKYDLRGRRQFEIVDPDNLALTTEYVYDVNDNVVARLDTKSASTKLTTRYVYDDSNRLSWQIDATGAVTQTEYDASGNISRVTAYAKLIDLTAADLQDLQASTATLVSGKVGTPNAAVDHVTRYVYDTDNRLSLTIDSQGYGVRNEYDKAGNVVVKTRYAAKIPMLADTTRDGRVTFAVDMAALANLADDSKDQVEQYIYDGAHRVIGHVDAQGGYTLTEYRNNNREIRTTRYVNAVVYPTTPPAGTAKNRLVTNTPPTGVSTAPVAASITVPSFLLSSGGTGKDVVSYQWLDSLGHTTGVQDGAGYVTTYELDGMGRVLRTVDQSNNAQFNVYDKAGRLTLATDALGTITKTSYDALGRVTKTSQIEGALAPDMGANVGYGGKLARDLSQSMGNVNNGDTVTVTGLVKADDGVLALITLGNLGGTVQVSTSKTGVRKSDSAWQSFTLSYTHTSATPMALWLTMNGDNSASRAGMDSIISYDDLSVQVLRSGTSTPTQVFSDDFSNADPQASLTGYTITGNVTRTQYEYLDGMSNAWLTLLAGSTSATVTHVGVYTYDDAGRLIGETQAQGTTEQATTRYVLNKLGQREKVIDPRGIEAAEGTSAWAQAYRQNRLGYTTAPNKTTQAADYQKLLDDFTTTQVFDGQGHVTQTKDALGGTTNTQFDAFGNAIRIQDPNTNYGYFFFNELNQATWQVDPLGYATETRYNSLGQVDTIVKYAKPLKNWTAGATNPATPLNPDAVTQYKASHGNALPTGPYAETDTQDATTTITHDKVGRQTAIKDAMGFTESMTYDALGNKTSFTAKSPTSTATDIGGIYQYEYDKRGLLIKETLPETVKQYNTSTGAVTNSGNTVINKYEYDARGNKTKAIEAVGLQEERTTTYAYDYLDRQIAQTGQAINIYTVAGGDQANQTPKETRSYDAANNLIEVKAADGGRTLTYYDQLNRKVAEVSPTGTLIKYGYDAAGYMLSMTIYGDAIDMPTTAGGTAPAPKDANNCRITLFAVDARGRQTQATIQSVTTGQINTSSGSYEVTTGDVITKTDTDANGNVIYEEDARKNATYSYYDKAGHKILQVDAERFVTKWDYYGNGKVKSMTRYAKALASDVTVSKTVTAQSLIDKIVATLDEDRTSEYDYDLMGRIKEERTLKVTVTSLDVNHLPVEATQSVSTKYEYSGLGMVTKRTDAALGVTEFSYDKQGRQVLQQDPTFTDSDGAANVRHRIKTEFTGLGLERRSLELGKTEGSEDDDHITVYSYNGNGVRIAQTDAQNVTQTFKVDAMGRITSKSLVRTDADGGKSTDTTDYQYDLVGRQTRQIVSNTPQGQSARQLQTTETKYNTYGDIIAKGTNGGWQEFAEFDKAGRLFKSNTDSGAVKVYVNDARGNVTLTVESSDTNLKSMTLDTILGLTSGARTIDTAAKTQLQSTSVLMTFTVYDKNNRVTDTYSPALTGVQQGGSVQANMAGQSVFVGNSSAVQTSPSTSITTPNTVPLDPTKGSVSISPNSESITIRNYLIYGNSGWPQDNVGLLARDLTLAPTCSYLGNGAITIHYTEYFPSQNGNPEGIFYETDLTYTGTPIPVHPSKMSFGSFRMSIFKKTDDLKDVLIGYLDSNNSNIGTFTYPITTQSHLIIKAQPTGDIDHPEQAATKVVLFAKTDTSPMACLFGEPLRDKFGQIVKGMFSVSLPNGSSGSYTYFALNDANKIVNTAYGTFNASAGNETAAQTGSSIKDINWTIDTPNGSGWFFPSESSRMNMILPAAATKLKLRYKYQKNGGAATDWITVDSTDSGNAINLKAGSYNLSPATPGWFNFAYTWLPFTAGDTYNYTFDVVATNDGGTEVNRFIMNYTRSGNGSVMPSGFVKPYSLQSSIVKLTEATSTKYVDLSYKKTGTQDSPVVVRLSPTSAGSGLFNWDASALTPDPLADYNFELTIKAYADGDLLSNLTNATVKLGPNATVVSANVLPPPQTLRLTPSESTTDGISISYRKMGDTSAAFTALTAVKVGSEFRVDLSSIALPASGSVEYEYIYDAYQGSKLLNRANGSFFVQSASATATGVANRLDWSISSNTLNNTIHKAQAYNAFGEVKSETDGRGNTTTFTYTTLGKLQTKVDPSTKYMDTHGDEQPQLTPTTRYYYDAMGRQIGTKDARSNSITQTLLAGFSDGQLRISQEFHPDTGNKSYAYDVFGNLRYLKDEEQRKTDYTYDKNNRLTKVERPTRGGSVRAYDVYDYDEAGNRIAHTTTDGVGTSPALFKDKVYYDGVGRIWKTVTAEGRETKYDYTYDAAITGIAAQTVGGWRKVTTDAVGRQMTDETDVFGHTTLHKDMGGHTFNYAFNSAGWMTSQTSLGAGGSGQNIVYEMYANGYVKSIWDKAVGTYTSYEYDANGNKTFEGYVYLRNPLDLQGGVLDYYQYAVVTYDELNRVKTITDPKATIKYDYDEVGNRRHVKSVYNNGVNGAQTVQEYWYTYDSMNRFLISMGSLVNREITRGALGGDGVEVTYNLAGERKTATYAIRESRDEYSYTAEGYLQNISVDTNLTDSVAAKLSSTRTVDLMGRTTRYDQFDVAGVSSAYNRTTTYDKDSRVLTQTGTDGNVEYIYFTDNTDNAATATAQGKGGLARVKTVTPSQTTLYNYYHYAYWDDAKQTDTTVVATNPKVKGDWAPGFARQEYDANGHLVRAVDAGTNGVMGDGDDRVLRYATNAQGLILRRDEVDSGAVRKLHNYYYLDGHRVGEVGNDGDARVDYVQSLAKANLGRGDYKNWKPIASADFDQNFEPITANYPGNSPSSYTVRNGDKLPGIAQAVWGDSTLWYLIADANGLTGSENLPAGMVLTIPNKVTNIHNNNSTFRVYNAGEAIGDVSPTLPDAPPPPPPKKCGVLGQIISAVIIVVATIYGGPLGAMAANMLIQYASVSMGYQERMVWKNVAIAGVTAAITGGMDGGAASSATAAALQAAAVNVVTQAALVALHLQEKFDWAAVAVAGVGGAINFGVAKAFSGVDINPFAKDVLSGTTSGILVGAAHAAIYNEEPNWGAIAASSFGNALGGAAAGYIKRSDDAVSRFIKSTGEKISPPDKMIFSKSLGDSMVEAIAKTDAWKAVESAGRGVASFFTGSGGAEQQGLTFSQDVAQRDLARRANSPLWAMPNPNDAFDFSLNYADGRDKSTGSDAGAGVYSRKTLSSARSNLDALRARIEGRMQGMDGSGANDALWSRALSLVSWGQDSLAMSGLMASDPDRFANLALTDARSGRSSLMGFYLNMDNATMAARGADALSLSIATDGRDRAQSIGLNVEKFVRTSLLPRLEGLNGVYENVYASGYPSLENVTLFPKEAANIASLNGFTSILSGSVLGLGQLAASGEITQRQATARGMYELGMIDSASLDAVSSELEHSRSGLINDVGTSLLGAEGKALKVLGGVLLSGDAFGGKATAPRTLQRKWLNTAEALLKNGGTSLSKLSVATTLGRYASIGGAIDAVKTSGLAAETFTRVYAESLGMKTFNVQRSNGTGFDLLVAKLDANGAVADVTALDVKNTANAVDSITAFGAGAKRGSATYLGNLEYAKQVMAARVAGGDPYAASVLNALKNQTFGVGVVTGPAIKVDSAVVNSVRSTTGKTLQTLQWLP